MNKVLLTEIVKHVLYNFGVLPSPNIDNKTKSIMHDDYLLDKTISFDSCEKEMWGCKVSFEQKDFTVILGNCTLDKECPEYCMVIQMQGAPAYALYISFEDFDHSNEFDSYNCLLCGLLY